jgi:hypothetical protein
MSTTNEIGTNPHTARPESSRALAAYLRRRHELEERHRDLRLRAKVEQRLLKGARRFTDHHAELIASDLAIEAMTWLVRLEGDAGRLTEVDLAALRWAGVEPNDRETWFLHSDKGRGRDQLHPRQPVRFVRDTEDQVWLTKPILRTRGWTEAGIRDFLPPPEGCKRNPRFPGSGAPMPVWSAESVAKAESTPAWKDWLYRSLERRNTSIAALEAAIEDDDFRRRAQTAAAAVAACRVTPPCPVSPSTDR